MRDMDSLPVYIQMDVKTVVSRGRGSGTAKIFDMAMILGKTA